MDKIARTISDRIYLDEDWQFTEQFEIAMTTKEYKSESENLQSVRIPHTVKETPYHYFDEQMYQMLSGYRRILSAPKTWKGKKILLTFEGVAHDSKVFVNGVLAGEHHCGYTAFTLDIGPYLQYGKENVLAVMVDSRETLNIPPFGFVIDYMTYGGIYRDVYLEIKEKSYIQDVYVRTKLSGRYEKQGVFYCKAARTISRIRIVEAKEGMVLRQCYRQKGTQEWKELTEEKVSPGSTQEILGSYKHVELWDIEHPALYEIETVLFDPDGNLLDRKITTFGFRKAVFKADGFYLNGKKCKIRGLNRHQSYPYVGYAMPESMQILDADILKKELGVNAVRTSHYPQAQCFVDRCDEIGLLVFTELPGWQHIGDADWKKQAITNVEDMVKQYRNHPSIIMWGVRINESVDDDEFYQKTNEVAHQLDPDRPTGGVRCYKKGSFLEDVYTYNDFSHDGKRKGCEEKKNVTSDMSKPYLISEYNGHMYPSKAFDWEEHRMEHMVRHATVLDQVAKEQDIAGSFGWCMFDYNTHKDFGSGDRICYHGVCDMFRNPKLAAYVYAIQDSKDAILEISSAMDIGEHPGCNRGEVYILSNADSVKMYKNGRFLKEYTKEMSEFKNLAHGPIRVDDYIGDALTKGEEGMSEEESKKCKTLLNKVARVGLYGMSKKTCAMAGIFSAFYKVPMTKAVELYNTYVGDWGQTSTVYEFEAIVEGKVVKKRRLAPMTQLCIQAKADHTTLKEIHTYDVAAVRIRMEDENGNIMPYANEPLLLETQGAVELIGPKLISLAGGMGGCYVKTVGKKGKGKLILTRQNGESFEIAFDVVKESR